MKYEIRISRAYDDGVTKYTVTHVSLGVFDGAKYYDTVLCRSCVIDVFLNGNSVEHYAR